MDSAHIDSVLDPVSAEVDAYSPSAPRAPYIDETAIAERIFEESSVEFRQPEEPIDLDTQHLISDREQTAKDLDAFNKALLDFQRAMVPIASDALALRKAVQAAHGAAVLALGGYD